MPWGGVSPQQGLPGDAASTSCHQQAGVGEPARCLLLPPRGVGRRALWGLPGISAAVRTAWPLPKALVPFFSCFLGHFWNQIYSTGPQLIDHPNAGPSAVRGPEPVETAEAGKHCSGHFPECLSQ